jgi:hypothetical protein
MTRRWRLGNAFVSEKAVDPTRVFALTLAAWTLVLVSSLGLPFPSSAAGAVVRVAAAIGVFASLAVLNHRRVTTARSHRGALER